MPEESVIDPKAIRPGLDDGLAKFLRKACASEREQRFGTASEMLHELRRIRATL